MREAVARLTYDSTTAQALAAGDAVTFSSTTLSEAVTYSSDGSIQLRVPGTYFISANFTALATAAGEVEIEMQEAGSSVAGASAKATAAASGDYVALAFSALTTVHPTTSPSYASISFVAPGNNLIIVQGGNAILSWHMTRL